MVVRWTCLAHFESVCFTLLVQRWGAGIQGVPLVDSLSVRVFHKWLPQIGVFEVHKGFVCLTL